MKYSNSKEQKFTAMTIALSLNNLPKNPRSPEVRKTTQTQIGASSEVSDRDSLKASLVVQWLRTHMPMQGADTGPIPGLGRFRT